MKRIFLHHTYALGIALLALLILTNCGGSPAVTPFAAPNAQNPVPSISSISPGSSAVGSSSLTLTIAGSNFVSESTVRWGGTALKTSFVSNTNIRATIPSADFSTSGSVAVTVSNPLPGGGISNSIAFTIAPIAPLAILTTRLPDAQLNKPYEYSLSAEGGIAPYHWTVNPVLPNGLSISSDGKFSGTPPAGSGNATFNFAVQVSDSASQPSSVLQPLSIFVHSSSLGRNDTCATATPIGNGVIRASISPYGDIDVYSFNGTAGSAATIETFAQRLLLYGDPTSRDIFLDTYLELLDSSCRQLASNDDLDPGITQDSLISFTLPYTGTYYIRVSDFRGDGRPDFIYDLHLSGGN
jgi:hypothetical protein